MLVRVLLWKLPGIAFAELVIVADDPDAAIGWGSVVFPMLLAGSAGAGYSVGGYAGARRRTVLAVLMLALVAANLLFVLIRAAIMPAAYSSPADALSVLLLFTPVDMIVGGIGMRLGGSRRGEP